MKVWIDRLGYIRIAFFCSKVGRSIERAAWKLMELAPHCRLLERFWLFTLPF